MKLPIPKLNLAALLAKAKGAVRLPSFKKKPKDEAEAPPVDAAEDDTPSYLKPTFFQRYSHLLPAVGTYALVILSVLGIATYLLLNEDDILAEQAAMNPVTRVTEFEMVKKEPEAAHGDMADQGEQGHAAADTATDGHTPPADAGHGEAAAPPPSLPEDDGPDPYAGNLAPPDPGLAELVESVGQIPRIGDDGRTPWQVYARPSSSLETRPRVGIVVLNLGLGEQTTERALRLPGPVTLSFSPYARGLEEWVKRARDAGHEVLIGLPMEPRDFPRSDAGLLQLMVSAETEQNALNLHRVMSSASGYIGLVNDQGSGFTASRASVQPIMEDLAKRGLIYFDTLTNATSVAPEEARAAGIPNATADLTVVESMPRPTITARLSQIELLAKSQNSAIVAVQPFPMLLDRVGSWARELRAKELALTPLSGVITARRRGE